MILHIKKSDRKFMHININWNATIYKTKLSTICLHLRDTINIKKNINVSIRAARKIFIYQGK